MKVDFKTRFWEIDLLRGIAIIMMLVSNAITSLIYFDVINISNRWFWLFFARITAILFILLVGISLTLSYARIKDWNTKKIFLKYLKRGLTIFSWGLAITLVSWFFIREDFIVFGVAFYSFEKLGAMNKYAKYSNFIGGILMLIIGGLMILKPELLVF